MTLHDALASLRGKKITVVGAGISNRPLIRAMAREGLSVTVRDRAEREVLGAFYDEMNGMGVCFILGPDYLEGDMGDIVFRTPGMHPFRPELKHAAESGAVVTSEMELFFSLCPCRVIAVTGSDGKTTTTTLISELLKNAGYTVWLGGNIGSPLLTEVDRMRPEDIAVLELSSFQLHSMTCAPDVAVITNLAPNHLDVHPDYRDYIDAKKQIYKNQRPGGLLVLNRDNDDTAACAGEANGSVLWFSRRGPVENGAFLRDDGMLCLSDGGVVTEVLPAAEMQLPGDHNIENMLAAFAAVRGYADIEAMRETARSFTGVAHRLEKVRVLRGVTYINDSIASSPNRTIAGLKCFGGKIILIAGGKDKGIPYDALGPVICEHVKRLYLTGMTAGVIRRAVEKSPEYRPGAPEIFEIDDFSDAIRAAASSAREGDVVLLSPASTSFDRFKNFEERGAAFRAVVEGLE